MEDVLFIIYLLVFISIVVTGVFFLGMFYTYWIERNVIHLYLRLTDPKKLLEKKKKHNEKKK